MPAISIDCVTLLTGWYSSEYVVATKSFSNFKYQLGSDLSVIWKKLFFPWKIYRFSVHEQFKVVKEELKYKLV